MGEQRTEAGATLRLVASEVIFGTLGLFVRLIPLSSTALAASRGILGALFLLAFGPVRCRHQSELWPPPWPANSCSPCRSARASSTNVLLVSCSPRLVIRLRRIYSF